MLCYLTYKLILHLRPMFCLELIRYKAKELFKFAVLYCKLCCFRYCWWFSKKPIKLLLPLSKEALTHFMFANVPTHLLLYHSKVYNEFWYFFRDDEHHLIAQYCQSLNGDTSQHAVSLISVLFSQPSYLYITNILC